MTSPRQKKKKLATLTLIKKAEELKVELPKVETKAQTAVVIEAPVVVESTATNKTKKLLTKNALVETKTEETKSIDQVVEQSNQEVKTPTKE
jgi:hypothetical protein